MEYKHNLAQLRQMQSLPLDAKIIMTQQRIKAYYDYWDGNVTVSFSGGKDSTVLKHIVDGMYDDVKSVFVNTGMQYPEIQRFVNQVKAGKYDVLNSNVVILKPQMRFKQVFQVYGYPVISKEVSRKINQARNGSKNALQQFDGLWHGKPNAFASLHYVHYKNMLDAPFKISDRCCNVMKKKPFHKYQRETKTHFFIGTLADESIARRDAWFKTGCNSFEKDGQSKPLSFWTEQDVLHYLKRYSIPYASVYGEIVHKNGNKQAYGQINMLDVINSYEDDDLLTTTGVSRTGCMFCLYGAHSQKFPTRFQRMKITHPIQYNYCLRDLGLKNILDFLNVPYD